MRFLYRPNHPQANENGMVEASLVDFEVTPRVYVISDTMDPLKHMGTGQIIDSKAKFRQATRASNCIEMGTEKFREGPKPQIRLDKRQRREDIKRSIYQLRNGIN